ncbi:MAG: hypothetical protein A2W72_08565 [Burkholderiales bacterium RIFCSPLOWO2_12_67_14]|nr:MAG: hypothetical protein A2W72_08565 [Burkholderiales bacterium RIFCSPLOWO2_12_67_14]
MAVTILHISDLHRDSGSQLTSTTLLQSLLRDKMRFLSEGHETPVLAVVSGDIVFGVRPLEEDADKKLAAQYDEALGFLIALTDEYFEGDRERVIIVPGNHDVSMPHVKRAVKATPVPSDAEDKMRLVEDLFSYDTKFRWDWGSFSAYEIVYDAIYADRMAPFADFYGRFYRGKRTYSLDPAKQYVVHDFPDLGLAFLALSSCHQNDLYNRTGRIHPDALAQATGDMIKLSRLGRLGIGVWHHNIEGGPNDNDYVDPEFLQILMDGMCMIGMHGHQHKPQLLEHRFSADQRQGISIISAGTLCGGPRSLPSGRLRSYNIIKLDINERKGTVFVRSMTNSDFSSPVWAGRHIPEFGGDSVDFKLIGEIQAPDAMAIASEADHLIRAGLHRQAFEAVKQNLNNQYLRRIALDALLEMRDWSKIIENFSIPQNPREFVTLSTAYEESEIWTTLKELHEGPFSQSQDLAVRQRIDMMRATLQKV